MKSFKNLRGISLAEILTSLLILGLLAGGMHQFYRVMMESVSVLETASEAQEGTRISIELIQRDLRDAGFSPDGSLQGGVRYAASDGIGIARDLNGDHDTNDANERVAYLFDRDRRRLVRQMGDAAPQPMLNDLADEGLSFAYYADEGEALQPDDGTLSNDERERIRRIDIDLIVELPHPYSSMAEPIRCHQTSTVTLRNGS